MAEDLVSMTAEQRILVKLDGLEKEVRELKAMVCPVCGPAIHSQNHPEAVDLVIRPAKSAAHNGHR